MNFRNGKGRSNGRGKMARRYNGAASSPSCSSFELLWFVGLAVLGMLSVVRLLFLSEESSESRRIISVSRRSVTAQESDFAVEVWREHEDLSAHEVAPRGGPRSRGFQINTDGPSLPQSLPFVPDGTARWVIVTSIDHCQRKLRQEELAAMTSWLWLKPAPQIVLMCDCDEGPAVPENVKVVFQMSFLFQSLRRLGGISVAADRAKENLQGLAALAWMDISIKLNTEAVLEFSRLFALLSPHPHIGSDAKINRKEDHALLSLPVWNNHESQDFKIVLTPPNNPSDFESTGLQITDYAMLLWTVPGAPSWAEWLTASPRGDQDEYGEDFREKERERCNPPLKSCYECETTDGEQNCAVCKNFMYLSFGRCRKRCRPGTGQVERGKGRFFRYCTDPKATRITTTTTTTTEPLLPPIMPEVKAVIPEASPDGGDDDTSIVIKDVLIFTTMAKGKSTETTDLTQDGLLRYCTTWGCKVHFHQSVDREWPGLPKDVGIEKFERYNAFLALFDDERYSTIKTFVFIDAEGTIVRQGTDMNGYLPSDVSPFDVYFGNQKSLKKAGRPNTAFIAARRTSTSRMLFEALAKGNCAIECGLTHTAISDTFDECCVNQISRGFARVATISQETPVHAFSSREFTKMSFENRALPPILQCANNECNRKRAVVDSACNYRRDAQHCRDVASTAALLEASRREIWQTCKTYVYDNNKCAPEGSISSADIETNSFTIVVSTFARDDALLSVLPHWLGCNNVSSVLVVWHDPSRAVIDGLKNLESAYKRLTVLQQKTDQLSNRYLEGHHFKTEAVFSVDDDEWYSSALMTTAFGAWRKEGGETMVAFNPRRLNFSLGSEEAYAGNGYQWNGVCKADKSRKKFELPCGHYNTLFVTKGGFLNRRFHRAYFEPAFSSPRDMVNKWSTGEDILMTAVHAALASPLVDRKILAVSALSRHVEDYYGTLSLREMEQQFKDLQRDPNSLHFLTENRRGDVRMEVIRNMASQKMAVPEDTTIWYQPQWREYADASKICSADLGVSCHVF